MINQNILKIIQKKQKASIFININPINKKLKISKLIKFPSSYHRKNLTKDTKQDYLRVKNFFDQTDDPIKTSWNKILN